MAHFIKLVDQAGIDAVVDAPAQHLGVQLVPLHRRQHAGAAARAARHQPLAVQPLHRFAQCRTADLQCAAQHGFRRQHLAGGVFAGDDAAPEFAGDV